MFRFFASWLTYLGQATFFHIILFPFILAVAVWADYKGLRSDDIL